ncbi:unnamed protein product [Pseudo-nitzschia multistriata]|uniref:Uncharacterized protein n=1 Tax=Pseudo-nitzschia multistriata TaxID=183589 RepID=A0A448ZIX1_9STRA|nr:unnamed protein product [Pseudo-nitzschia multistriata]
MKVSLCLALAATAATQSNALTTPTDRRGAFGQLLGAGAGAFLAGAMPQAASAAAIKTGGASPFTGDYNDPNHPECLRQVKVVGAPLKGDGTRSPYPVIEVVGYDGKGGKVCTDRPTREDLWKVTGTVKSSDSAFIDFSPKGGPENLAAKYQDGGIVFPDGNKWTKVARGTPTRRPKDMSTLKSED